ncbi:MULTISPECIES: DNA gyrase inhibitor YacG [Glaesserella]|uniref:DNA gyrase inhibitor YacG n=1 Tax=Glaesserella australis TaxID=2094024 RepID=A0A328C029_9PAST|nr:MULTISPECIES: DNA gyrase inhibitor YacG [Glaesserella]AUI65370.1 DNA gyrase inhibitor YacG [Glaesserella sp. 15-184]RAL18642.1 DNA gyrase inhibitor YacG [Glaesserella australis]
MTVVNCPTCEKEVVWSSESKYRPFCSERCQLIDLGEWANEEKRIAGNQTDNDVMSSNLV